MGEKYAFLHIGKTGGTAFREVIKKHNSTHGDTHISYISHKGSLRDIAKNDTTDKLIFFVRDPVSRFVSAFNSRLRKGRYGQRDWRPGEAKAFDRFKTPNELAEALNSWNPFTRIAAERALSAIGHLRKPLNAYVGPLNLLEAEKDRIFYIGAQETLSEDFEILKTQLRMDPSMTLPSDTTGAHRAPDGMDRKLSDKAVANIRRYYAKDLPIYEWCLRRRAELLEKYGADQGKDKAAQ